MADRILQRKGEISPAMVTGQANDVAGLVSPNVTDLRSSMRLEHWAWVLLFFNLVRLLPRGEDVTGLDPHSSYRILLVVGAAILVALSLLGNARSIGQLVRPPMIFLFIYSLVAIGSALTASVVFYSLWKATEMLVLTGAVAALLGMHNPRAAINKAYNIVILFIAVLCYSVWLGAIFAPNQAFYPQSGLMPFYLGGVFPLINPNTLGFFSAVTALVLTARLLRYKNKQFLYGALWFIAIVTLIMSNSRTGLAAYVLGLLAYSVVDNRKKIAGFLILLGLVLAMVGPIQDLAGQYLGRGQHIESLKTMSGRTNAWQVAYDYFLQSPYVGHGYAAAGRFDVLANKSSHLHGSIFEVIVGLGIMGLVPWLLWIIFTGMLLYKAWRNVVRRAPPGARSLVAEWTGLFVILIVRSSTSSTIYAHNIETMLFCVIMAAAMAGVWRGVARAGT